MRALVHLHVLFLHALRTHRLRLRRHRGDQRGQATAEYALVLLGAAAVALLLAAWAARSGKITQLFDAVTDRLIRDAR